MEPTSIIKTVNERYARAVLTEEEMCCPTGYDHEELRTFIPDPVLKVSYGCGTPVGLSTAQPGETVLDIGSGGGIDCFEASRRVGLTGRVIGIDMTDEMLTLARTHAPTVAKNLGYSDTNVEFRKGQAEAIPVDDASIDLIVSNCVINLSPDKAKVFQEMYRVIRPSGRFTISDIVADQSIPNYLLHDKEKWGDCLSGALPLSEYWQGLLQAGFLGIHQINVMPWKTIDGIHFLSVTLTGHKLTHSPSSTPTQFATLKGPFSRVKDELGNIFVRGIPECINPRTSMLLQQSLYKDLLILSDTPIGLTPSDPQWTAVLPEEKPVMWEGDFGILTGPFLEISDEDHNMFQLGVPREISSSTVKVLQSPDYLPYFSRINRSGETPHGTNPEPSEPSGGCC